MYILQIEENKKIKNETIIKDIESGKKYIKENVTENYLFNKLLDVKLKKENEIEKEFTYERAIKNKNKEKVSLTINIINIDTKKNKKTLEILKEKDIPIYTLEIVGENTIKRDIYIATSIDELNLYILKRFTELPKKYLIIINKELEKNTEIMKNKESFCSNNIKLIMKQMDIVFNIKISKIYIAE